VRRPDHPIRVLRVIARLNVGGPALHVAYLSSGLAERGYETVLAAGRVGEDEGSMEYIAEDLGLRPLYVPHLRREISPSPDLGAVARLREIIREFRPDILHTHTAKAGAVGRAAALLSGHARPKVVVHTFHGHVLQGYFRPAFGQVFSRIERELARTTDALVAVSPQIRDDLVRLGIAPADRIAVIRLGLDLASRTATSPDAATAFRRELAVPPDRFLVAWLGRMTEVKRVDVLLDSFRRLLDKGTDADLALIGGGPLAAALEERARDLGIRDRCHFTGFRSDVGSVYAAADVVVLTSANEGTPVTLIEAQAAGKPVVSTDVGGVPDVVVDGSTGLLAASGDADGVAARLHELSLDRGRRDRMGAAGRKRVLERYGVDRLVRDVDDLYRSLLGAVAPTEHRVVTARSRPLVRALTRPSQPVWRCRSERLKVILVSQYFPPEVGATQSRIQAFAEHLSDRGHTVTVISEFPNHPHGIIPPEYRGRIFEDDCSNGYRTLRVWVSAHESKTALTRMQLYLSFMATATAITPVAGRADVVLATSPPLFAAVAGAAIARLTRAPFVLDIRDLWPAAAVSLNQLSNPAVAHMSNALEAWLYREATATVAVTRPFCDHIDRFRDPVQTRTALVPNGTLELFLQYSGGNGRVKLGIDDDRFLLTFAGLHGIAQGLPSILDTAEQIDGEAAFAFVGDGPVKDALVAEAKERGLSNVHFLPQVPLEATPEILGASDALLVPLSKHPTFSTFVPSKMMDFMAMGKPVVLAAAGEAARILTLAGAGVVVPPEDPESLANAVRWLRDNPEEASEMGRRGREFARSRLRGAQAERLEEILVSVADRHRG
jgi:glycosyltransferase involved in cell wall biosynthesis